MSILLSLLLLAPAAPKTAEVVQLLEKDAEGNKVAAVALLRDIGKLEGDHEEAEALVKMIRDPRLDKPKEVLEEAFLALKGIKSRKVTRRLLRLLDHSRLKKDPAIRIGVARALSGSADPDGVEALVDLMRDVDDHVIAEAAEAAGAYRHAKEPVRKELFKTILDIYTATWNLKNSVSPELRVKQRRAEEKWEVVEQPMERSLQLLSNVTQRSPSDWRRWWNENKHRRWADLEN